MMGAVAEQPNATQKQRALWNLFAQHEAEMAAVHKQRPRLYSARRVAELARSGSMMFREDDRVRLEREEMALRRKFVLRPAALTV